MRQQERARLRTTPSAWAYEASYTKHEHRQVHEGVNRGLCPVHPVAEPAEGLEPAERALDHIALPLDRGVFGVQLADGLLRRDAGSCRDEWPEAMIVDTLPNAPAVVPLVRE